MSPNYSLVDAKYALRAKMLALRDAMPLVEREAAAKVITRRVTELDAYRKATFVSSFMSFGAEPSTDDFFERILSDGKVAVISRIDKESKSLILHRVTGYADLEAGVWGIRQPRPDLPVVDLAQIDMMLMPGLAFDHAGHRLGYGAGFYDRLLARASHQPVRVVGAFDCQVIEQVPAGPTDKPFHILVTESQLHFIST